MKFVKLLKEQNWAGFALEFLAVVLGIVITFAGEAIISSHNEQVDVKNSLQLVKDELQDNLSYILEADSLMEIDGEAARFLIRFMGHYDEAPKDTLYYYCNYPMYLYTFYNTSQALELLKSSSIFSKIKDKSLALDIIHAYGNIEEYIRLKRSYLEKKKNLVDEAVNDDMKKLLSVPHITAQKFWTTITSTTAGVYLLHELRISSSMNSNSEHVREITTSTIEKIDLYCE